MKLDLRYLGKSGVSQQGSSTTASFSPNLARPKVFFDGELVYPLRFREAMSALHDVVVGDLRFKKKDKTAYEAFKAERDKDRADLRKRLMEEAQTKALAKIAKKPIPPNLDKDFQKMHRLYWDARVRWANELARSDPELFRHLVPCDPVVTVAPDVVFFECFSKDESAYGCLMVDRGALKDHLSGLGTTNVDYSLALYEHFQTLRSYRSTRLLVDPTGFEVKVDGRDDYREEKIDLPPSWLRGFGQLQATMTMPSRSVDLPVETVYSILAHLKRHREKTGPRSLRFQLTPGRPPVVVLDPWGIAIQSRGRSMDDVMLTPGGTLSLPSGGGGPYRSAPAAPTAITEEIKVWGRRRLFALARLLPLADRVEVRLFGTGMPSVWIVHLGEMRFVLALSGWTANDWTSGGTLQLLRGVARPDLGVTSRVMEHLEEKHLATVPALATAAGANNDVVLASLYQLSTEGQVVFDFAADRFRYRPVMPVALSEAVLGPEPPELAAGRQIAAGRNVRVEREEALGGGRRHYQFKAQDTSAECVVDADLAFRKAKCTCSHFYKNGLRAGPCRHLIAFRLTVLDRADIASVAAPAQKPPSPSVAQPAQPAQPPMRTRAGAQREEVVSLAPDIFKEMIDAATRRDLSLAEVIEAAWDETFEQIAKHKTWKAVLAMAPATRTGPIALRSVSDPVQQSVYMHVDVLNEIASMAQTFGASPSAVMNLAWLLSRSGK